MPDKEPKDTKRTSKTFPIVGIGASAGGLEAIKELLQNLSPETGMTFVYIQHLDPTHKSMLSAILGRETKMKVLEAKHLMLIEPNKVYILPPNKNMAIIDGVLTLNPRQPRPTINMPIDKFFVSMAEKQKEGSIGIILSGNANDGTYGLKSIKMAGGLTFAQDDSAKFQSMPKSAIAEGVVDMILSPAEIAKELERLSKQPAIMHVSQNNDVQVEDDNTGDENEEVNNIIQLLKKSTGADFTHYKPNTIKRRIVRRMLLYKLESLGDYLQYLRQHTNELNILYQDLLINVTNFFRDPDTIEYLKKTLIPRILKTKDAKDPIRIWVPACSTGEEAYSLAMVFMEVLGEMTAVTSLQIFATDLSEIAIAKARLGLYSKNDLMDVSPKRIQRFFTKVDGSYRIIKSMRDLCVFAPHNVFKDPPFSRLDLISCCNLMIYLDTVLQKKIIATFHYALNSNGLLILGKSEAIGNSGNLFAQIEKKYKVFSKRNESSGKAVFDMNYRIPDIHHVEAYTNKKLPNIRPPQPTDIEQVIDNILLKEFAPPSVVINSDLEILQFRGSTGTFLEPSPGKASLNLLKMAKPGLAFDLRSAIHFCNKNGSAVKKVGVEMKDKDVVHTVTIHVLPLKTHTDEKLFLVIFQQHENALPSTARFAHSKDKLVKQLQEELATVKEEMRNIVEEQEASNEELQSANEEIVSSNEELQSINEELETSKEEVDSTNEELMTINNELLMRNEQLNESYDYSSAVFDTIREAVIVLDKDLRIKTVNQAFYRIFQVNEQDTEGILIYELGNKQWNIPQLRELLEDVIPRNMQIQGYQMEHTFPKIGKKIMLLNARRIMQKIHRQQLILIGIEDITEHKEAERLLAEREAWFRNMADNAPVMIWVSGTSKVRNFFNHTWLSYTGTSLEKALNNQWQELVYKDDLQIVKTTANEAFAGKKPFKVEYRLRRYDGEYRWILEIGKPTFDKDDMFTGYIGSCTEIHDKRLMHEELEQRVRERTNDLQELNFDMERSNSELQQFAYVASHDLQEPLRKIVIFSGRLKEHEEEISETNKLYIDKISESAQRMSRLIEDLLNFSSISKFEKNVEDTDLNAVINNVLIDLELAIQQKEATIDVGKLQVVKAVPLNMKQLFYNLINNALKFSSPDRKLVISITKHKLNKKDIVKIARLDPNKTYIDVVVKDNGIGFDQEFAEKIFVIFQRLNPRKQYPGTGIGLALCRKIAENHGGTVYATSKLNEGTEFHVVLSVNDGLEE